MKAQRKMGFTLIELLVVIAIIAILAAILFPVFAQAREKARQITCVSNEKQITLGILMYNEDYDERFPPAQWPNYSHDWDEVIRPYIMNGINNGDYDVTGGVFACPDYPGTPVPDEYMVRDDLFQSLNGSDQYEWPFPTLAQINSPSNKWMLIEGGASDPTLNWHPVSWSVTEAYWTNMTYWTSDVGAPGSEGLDNCDATAGDGNAWPAWDGPALTSGSGNDFGCAFMPRYRHAGNSATNVAYCDGHVSSVHYDSYNWCTDIYIPGLYGGDSDPNPAADWTWYATGCTGQYAP